MQLSSPHFSLKLFVSVDNVNGLWGTTKIRREDFTYADAADLSLVRHFKKLIQGNWVRKKSNQILCSIIKFIMFFQKNGVIVVAVDVKAHRGKTAPVFPRPHIPINLSHLPNFLLGKEGFELLDPFVPVKVEKYSDREIHSVIDYYIDRNWLQNPLGISSINNLIFFINNLHIIIGKTDEGREQLIHLSAQNPFLLERMCAAW